VTETATTTVRPLHDRILVRRLEAEAKSPGGLFIPEAAKERPVEGIVIAIGEGARNKDGQRIPLDVKVDDRVLFAKYSGTEIRALGDDHMILREDDILAVIGVAPTS
jgi:chaperonin GroES